MSTIKNNHLPATGFLRISQIIGNPKAKPPIPALIPVSKNTFLNWVRDGKAPTGILLSQRTRVWEVEKILAFIEEMARVSPTAATKLPMNTKKAAIIEQSEKLGG